MAQDFDFTEEVRGLQVPTLIVAADADMAPPSHYVEVFKLLDGGQRDGGWMGEGRPAGGHALAILPGLTHYNILRVAAPGGGGPRFLEPIVLDDTPVKETRMNFNSILIGTDDPQRLADYYTKLFGEPALEEGGYCGLAVRLGLGRGRPALRGPRQERGSRAGSSGTSRPPTSRATSTG